MTNYEKIINMGLKGQEEVVKALSNFIAKEIKHFAIKEEDGTDIEISNFEIYEIEQDLRRFFNIDKGKQVENNIVRILKKKIFDSIITALDYANYIDNMGGLNCKTYILNMEFNMGHYSAYLELLKELDFSTFEEINNKTREAWEECNRILNNVISLDK